MGLNADTTGRAALMPYLCLPAVPPEYPVLGPEDQGPHVVGHAVLREVDAEGVHLDAYAQDVRLGLSLRFVDDGIFHLSMGTGERPAVRVARVERASAGRVAHRN